MKFMHIADVHLRAVPDKGKPWSEQRGQEIRRTFRSALELVKQEHIDLLLIAGDLFHFPPTAAMLKDLDSQLAELEGTTTILIAGNHDYRAKGSPLDRYEFQSDTVCLAAGRPEQIVLEDLQTCVTGISYDRQEIPEGIYDDLTPEAVAAEAHPTYLQILLAHGGDSKHAPLNRNRLLQSDFHYIALGHIHKPEILAENRMQYPGSLEPIDCTDTGERGCVIGEAVRENGVWQVRTEWRRLCCRQYVNLEVEVRADMTNYQIQKQVQECIDADGGQNIYRILLRGRRSALFQPDMNGLMNLYTIYEVVDDTREDYELEQLKEENADNLLGRYIRRMEDGPDDELHQKAMEYGVRALMRCRELRRP